VLLHSLLPTDDACSSSVCQRPSSNFPYFRTPLANFLFSHPNSVEYGNSKTTTLLPSAKCTRHSTRPLFQGRTGCGGRPSGWRDIVTCRRLVLNISDWSDNDPILHVSQKLQNQSRRQFRTVLGPWKCILWCDTMTSQQIQDGGRPPL